MQSPDMFTSGYPNLGSSEDVLPPAHRDEIMDSGGSDHLPKYDNGPDCKKLISCKRKSPMFAERERRKCMKGLFLRLQALLPASSPKNDKLTILNETVKYIPMLQKRVEELRNFRALLVARDEMMMVQKGAILQASDAPDTYGVDIKVRHDQVIVTLSNPKDLRPLSAILEVLQSHGLDVIHGGVFRTNLTYVRYFHTMYNDTSSISLDSLQRRLQMLVSR